MVTAKGRVSTRYFPPRPHASRTVDIEPGLDESGEIVRHLEPFLVLSAALGLATACSSKGSGGHGTGPDSGSDSPLVGPSDANVPCDGGTLIKPAEVTRVAGWLSDTSSGLPSYAYTNIDTYFPSSDAAADPITGHYPRSRLVDSIVGACSAFAPRLANWQATL